MYFFTIINISNSRRNKESRMTPHKHTGRKKGRHVQILEVSFNTPFVKKMALFLIQKLYYLTLVILEIKLLNICLRIDSRLTIFINLNIDYIFHCYI